MLTRELFKFSVQPLPRESTTRETSSSCLKELGRKQGRLPMSARGRIRTSDGWLTPELTSALVLAILTQQGRVQSAAKLSRQAMTSSSPRTASSIEMTGRA